MLFWSVAAKSEHLPVGEVAEVQGLRHPPEGIGAMTSSRGHRRHDIGQQPRATMDLSFVGQCHLFF